MIAANSMRAPLMLFILCFHIVHMAYALQPPFQTTTWALLFSLSLTTISKTIKFHTLLFLFDGDVNCILFFSFILPHNISFEYALRNTTKSKQFCNDFFFFCNLLFIIFGRPIEIVFFRLLLFFLVRVLYILCRHIHICVSKK